MGVYRNLGLEVNDDKEWETLFSSIESLGGLAPNSSQIRNVKDQESYAFITLTG